MRKLDQNPDDTAQAMIVIAALAGNHGRRLFRRFRRSPRAEAILGERRDLYAILCDGERLRAMPPGSLGRAIGDWFAREQIGAEGLAQADALARTQLGQSPQQGDREPVDARIELYEEWGGHRPLGRLPGERRRAQHHGPPVWRRSCRR
jgi:hypothetical protein